MNYNEIVTSNPETLLERGFTSQELFQEEHEHFDIDKLASQLAKASPVKVAEILAETQTYVTDETISSLVELMHIRLLDATPGDIAKMVAEAKQLDPEVWRLLRPHVDMVNRQIAKRIKGYENVDALRLLLEEMTNANGWLPDPIYHAAKEVLPAMLDRVDTMAELQKVADLADDFRLRSGIHQLIRDKDKELMKRFSRYEKAFGGYVLKKGTRQQLYEDARRAINAVEFGGWQVVED